MMATADPQSFEGALPSLGATSEQREMDDRFVDPQGRAMAEGTEVPDRELSA